jgi:hypothetical protein
VYLCMCVFNAGIWVMNRRIEMYNNRKADNVQDLMIQSVLQSRYFQKNVLERAHSLKLLFRVPQGP